MPRNTSRSSLKQMSEINLTPLMDLTFILLITFIITFPLIEQGVPVNLPKASAKQLSPDEACSITLDMKGGLYLDDVPVSHEQLGARVRELKASNSDTAFMVRADTRIPYGEVVEILKILHAADIQKMALVTESEGQ